MKSILPRSRGRLAGVKMRWLDAIGYRRTKTGLGITLAAPLPITSRSCEPSKKSGSVANWTYPGLVHRLVKLR